MDIVPNSDVELAIEQAFADVYSQAGIYGVSVLFSSVERFMHQQLKYFCEEATKEER